MNYAEMQDKRTAYELEVTELVRYLKRLTKNDGFISYADLAERLDQERAWVMGRVLYAERHDLVYVDRRQRPFLVRAR